VLKVGLRQEENAKASSARMLDQLQVALPAPVKVSIKGAESIITASSSREPHRLALRIRLPGRKVVLTVKGSENTKRKASMRRRLVADKCQPELDSRGRKSTRVKGKPRLQRPLRGSPSPQQNQNERPQSFLG